MSTVEDDEVTVWFIKQVGFEVGKAGRVSTLAKWIDNLIGDYLTDDPELLSLRGGAAVMLGEVEKGFSLLDEAILLFTETENITGYARALVWRATAYFFLGEYQLSLGDAEKALKITEGKKFLTNSRAEALKVQGLDLLSLGWANKAIDSLRQSLDTYDLAGDEKNASLVHMDLGLVLMNVGENQLAHTHYLRALTLWRKTNNLTQQANLLNNLGVLAYTQGDYKAAIVHIREGLDCAKRSGYVRMESFALASLGDIYTDLDAYSLAEEVYLRARQIACDIEERYLLIYLGIADARLARLRRNYTKAHQALDETKPFIRKSDSRREAGLWNLEYGSLSLSEGKLEKAVSYLDKASQEFKAGDCQIEEARAHLYLFQAKSILGEYSIALKHFKEAYQITTKLESLHPLVNIGREMKVFLEESQGLTQIEEQVSQLLETIQRFEEEVTELRHQFSPEKEVSIPLPPALNIRAFGRHWIEVRGESINKSEWVNQKTVRELFFFLLTQSDGLSKEAIGIALWPESSSEQLKRQFKNAVYRLRRALGKEVVIYNQRSRHYHFNRELDYRYDVEEFQTGIVTKWEVSKTEERLSALLETIAVYKHPYLSEIDGAWAEPIRARLYRDFKKAVLEIAEIYFESGKMEEAINYSHRLLLVDSCQEDAYRLAMRSYAKKGDRAGIARQYKHCKEMLSRELDTSPSFETEELYTQLMS